MVIGNGAVKAVHCSFFHNFVSITFTFTEGSLDHNPRSEANGSIIPVHHAILFNESLAKWPFERDVLLLSISRGSGSSQAHSVRHLEKRRHVGMRNTAR